MDDRKEIEGQLLTKKDPDTGDAEYSEDLPGGIGERIAFLRRRGGLTQAQLAEKLGISAQAVSKWEGGLSCPDIMMLMPLSRIFGVSTDVLLGGEGPAVSLQKPEAEEDKRSPEAEEKAHSQSEWQQKGHQESIHRPGDRIEALRVELGATQVYIRSGKEFSAEFIGYDSEEKVSKVDHGQWRIHDSWKPVVFCGFRNLLGGRKVIITIPQGHCFSEVALNIGAGTLTGEAITTERCRLQVGAGQMTLMDFKSGDARLDCGVGEIKVSGSLSGSCRMECGMGSISAELAPLEDVGYDLSCGMGEIQFGSGGISGIGGTQKMNPGAANFFRIYSGMGSVKVKWRK